MKFKGTRRGIRDCLFNMMAVSYAYAVFAREHHGYLLMIIFMVIALFLSVWEDIDNDGE